jgi:hypothetical protein
MAAKRQEITLKDLEGIFARVRNAPAKPNAQKTAHPPDDIAHTKSGICYACFYSLPEDARRVRKPAVCRRAQLVWYPSDQVDKVKELKEQVQVSQFWMHFRAWQEALHAQLGTAITIKSTLAALQWWAAHHCADAARSAVIANVRRQLKQLKRKHEGWSEQDIAGAMTSWSLRLHETAVSAAKELKQVNSLQFILSVLLIYNKLASIEQACTCVAQVLSSVLC